MSDQREHELAAVKHKLCTLESDSQKRISDLENELTDALSCADEANAAAAAAAAAASGECC